MRGFQIISIRPAPRIFNYSQLFKKKYNFPTSADKYSKYVLFFQNEQTQSTRKL
jgi:hypothetical protein